MKLSLLPLVLISFSYGAEGQQEQETLATCERDHPGCNAWPAYSISRAEFEASNGSIPAGWKAAWEENEGSHQPYNVAAALSALMEMKALVVEDPWSFTRDWAPGIHPCDFDHVKCNQHGMVTGVDLAGMVAKVPALVTQALGTAAEADAAGMLRGRASAKSGDQADRESEIYKLGDANVPGLVLKQLPEGPAWKKLGYMSLQILRFDNARLWNPVIPPSWGKYPHLKEISLGGCGLQGKLPEAWASLTKLQRLDLGENALTGTLPLRWSGMESLKVLDLSLSQTDRQNLRLSGSLPSGWQALLKLQVLDLWNQGITGLLPPSWGTMPALEVVSLGGTQISGTLPAAWATLQNLTTLQLSDTLVGGELPSSWGHMGNLSWLDLRGTQVAQGVPRSWRSFCSGKRSMGVFPSFAYFPWNGVTELNSVRLESELNLCSAWRRRQRWQAGVILLVLVSAAVWAGFRKQLLLLLPWRRWSSKHPKSK